MRYSLLPAQTPFAEQQLKTRLDLTLDQTNLFRIIDNDPALVGADVLFIDNHGTRLMLREFQPLCSIKPVTIVLREPPREVQALDYVADVKMDQRESRLVIEAAGATLACGAMVLGWLVVWTSSAAIPFSSGASGVVTVMAYGAATASSLQCLNGVSRVHNELTAPQKNDVLDSEEWYQHATMALDIISIGGATAAGLMTVRGVKILSAQRVTTKEALQGLNRQQRKNLSKEIARSNYPGISNKTIKMMERAGKLEKRYSNVAIRNTTLRQIKDSIGAGMTFGGSALGGGINKLAVALLVEE